MNIICRRHGYPLQNGLAYVHAILTIDNTSIDLSNVILDTGSESCVFNFNTLETFGIHVERDDTLRRIDGIGVSEIVFTKRIKKLVVNDLFLNDVEIDIGDMEYSYHFDGIIGLDFLLQTRAVIDFGKMELRQG